MNTNRAACACSGALAGVLLVGLVIILSGCSNNWNNNGAPLSPQQIFVVQGGSVSVFPLTANGNVAPTGTLSGGNTGLEDAHRLAFDSILNGYVTNAEGNSVTIYASGTSGNVLPTATISGAATGLVAPYGIDLDSQNNIYVANCGSCDDSFDSITIYGPGSTGNVAPVAVIAPAAEEEDLTGLDGPNGLTLDSSANIYVANEIGNTVTIYLAFSSGFFGNVPPLVTISGGDTGISRPHDLTVDPSGNLYVTNSSANSVTIYAAGDLATALTNGLNSIEEEIIPAPVDLIPAVTIFGAKTGLNDPNGIAFDASGNFYVTNNLSSVMVYSGSDIAKAIGAYTACLTGPPPGTPAACTQTLNEAPVATITGGSTGFEDVHGVSVQQTQVLK